jgi:hypothetical protein
MLLTMTESDRAVDESPPAAPPRPAPLKEALHAARIELAERTGVVVDMRNAEVARLQILNDALDPLFADIPPQVEMFDRGITPGEPPRLWIDMIAHVVMGRDKRVYRLVQDTRHGRRVLAESADAGEIATAVTRYVARRLVERERALATDSAVAPEPNVQPIRRVRGRRGRTFGAFLLGVFVGAAALLTVAWFVARP